MKIKPLKLIHLVACLFILASTSKAYAVNNCIIGDAVTDCTLLGPDITAVTIPTRRSFTFSAIHGPYSDR